MVQTLATHASCLHEDTKVADNLGLSCKIIKTQRTQGIVLLLLGHLVAYIEITHFWLLV